MERLVGVKLAFVSLNWNDRVGKRTSAAEMTDDWRPIKRQSKEMRTAEDVAQTFIDLPWIMNSSTTIDLQWKRWWIKDPPSRSSGNLEMFCFRSQDQFENIGFPLTWQIVLFKIIQVTLSAASRYYLMS